MSLTISVVDNADGSGGVATIAGSLGAVTSVYGQLTGGPAYPILIGTRLGDGTVPLALPVGYWSLYATTPALASNVLVNTAITSGQLAPHEQFIQAVKATLQALTFAAGPGGQPPALGSAQIYDQVEFTAANISYPCIVLAIAHGLTETETSTLAGTDDINYPVIVAVVARDDGRSAIANRPTYLEWRRQIYSKFRHQRMNAANIVNVEVTPMAIAEFMSLTPQSLTFEFLQSCLLIRGTNRELRG